MLEEPGQPYVIGVDIGGTFTDTVLWGPDGTLGVGKAFTTYADLGEGLLASIDAAAASLGLTGEHVLARATALVHGTTVGTNALVQRRGARVGLLCTGGHRDVLGMMRAAGRVAGLPIERLLDVAGATKPAPIVERGAIVEVAERTTAGGVVLQAVDEDEIRAAAEALGALGCNAVAIAFLWSVASPVNETTCADVVRAALPDAYVSTSHAIAPRVGEYERTAATVVNAFVGPTLTGYLGGLQDVLRERGFNGRLGVMTCAGGVVRPAAALERALLTIGSGPAAGVLACERLAHQRGERDVIATDMGGTTFDAALLTDGRIGRRQTAIVDQYEYFVETIDLQSIGSGGGSIARVIEGAGGAALRVGPESAGSEPGPVCYGQGGLEPTITDADLVLGLIAPERFLGGSLVLDVDAAERALAVLGRGLGLTPVEAAAGVVRIADERMADLIRRMTVQRGFDPRRFSVYAYGGAGPLHVGAYARALGAARAVVPLGAAASVWSAFGAAAADVSHLRVRSLLMAEPFDEPGLRGAFARLEAEVDVELAHEGFSPEQRRVRRLLEMRYAAQVHTLEISLDGEDDEPAAAWSEAVVDRFERVYESRYGKGTGYRKAGVEISAIKIIASGLRSLPELQAPTSSGVRSQSSRSIHWHELGGFAESAVIPYETLGVDDPVEGPAIIELATTSIVVRPGQTAARDGAGSVVLDLRSDSTAEGAERP